MHRIMLIGEHGVGRRSLVHALGFAPPAGLCPLAVEYAGPFVLPPPEFMENRRFYRALITSAMECRTLVFVQDATRPNSVFPPGFARTFNQRVLGLITKPDSPKANTARAERFLTSAGLQAIHTVNILEGQGSDAMRAFAIALQLPQAC